MTLGDYQSIVFFSLGKHQNNALVQILKQVHQAPTQDKWDVLADKLVIPNTGALIVLVLILFHFIRRVYETLYVHKSSKGKTASKQHIFVTISGLLYYVFVVRIHRFVLLLIPLSSKPLSIFAAIPISCYSRSFRQYLEAQFSQ